MRPIRRLQLASLAILLALPGAATASGSTRTTLYFHSPGPSASVDGALAFAGRGPHPTMDTTRPTGAVPKVAQTVTSAVANENLEANFLAAYWRGRVMGTLSNITVEFWAQDPRGSSSAVRVNLHIDGSDQPIQRRASAPAGPTPTRLVVSFTDLVVPVSGGITLQFFNTSRNVDILYDAETTPSNVSFDLAPLPSLGTDPRIDPTFGVVQPLPGGECADGDTLCERMMALKGSSQVVIAMVDTGINPYHVAFRRTGADVHPSGYIEGYPTDVPALVLSLDEPSYSIARAADDATVWSQVERERLYWIPGTNVIGAISFGEHGGGLWEPRPIIDDHLHGTGVASAAAGAGARGSDGAPLGSNPEALLVVVEGFGAAAVEWVRSQPWIDFVSGSYGDPYARPAGPDAGREHEHTRGFVLEDGRTACFSAGNGLSRTGLPPDRYSSIRPTSGPSWVVTVGAASPRNGQDYWWHSVPVDVASYGAHWPAAAPFSTTDEQVFSGTSSATPIVCGVFTRGLLEARRALGDHAEGIHAGGVPATGAPYASPALEDGVLTRAELEAAVFNTAAPEPFDPMTLASDPGVYPTTPAYFTYQGYGVVNVASGARAVEVLLGTRPLPDRSDVDAFMRAINAVRDAVYPPQS